MDPTIKKILNSNRVDGVFHTHVSLIQPKGKFQFNRQTLEEFWEAYCNYIETNENACVGIAEKPQQYLPVLVDVDLCIRDNDESLAHDGLYTEDQLKIVIETYQSVLRQIVESCTDEDLYCVVLEKNMYQQTRNEITYLKNGFHLHFPNIFLNKIDQETQLIPRVKQSINDAKLFENLGIEESGNVIDRQCCKVPWLLYGSHKEGAEQSAYKVTKIYDSHLNIISLEKAFKRYTILDHRERPIELKGKVRHYLPRILSIIPYGRGIKEIKRGIVSPLKVKLKERKSSVNHRKLGSEESLAIAKRLLPMIADFRADDRNEWMNIGWILFNETDGSADALDLWCEFSSRCEDKYDENVCIHTWERMTKGDLSLGTLRYYASIDNPTEYKKFKEEQCSTHITASLEGSHNDVAKALLAMYGDQFTCASYSGKTWFQFNNHIWEQIDEGVFLREKISGNFVEKYIEAIKALYDTMKDNQDKAKEAMTTARIKQVKKLIASLKNSTFKNSVMKECVAKGTLVSLPDGRSVKIEDMLKNQKVLTWDGSALVSNDQLFHLYKGKRECIKITLVNGLSLICTPDHKILRENHWVEAGDLKVGDMLRCTEYSGSMTTCQVPIENISDAGVHEVYDIGVDTNHSFLANGIVVHNCCEVFYDPRFKEKLDADPYLIAFKNGVYDLKLNVFRPGRPEDFLSKNMPINYVNFSEDDERVQEVHTFLEQVFPDKSVRKYFLDVSSDIFVGGNHEKIVLFWTGDGDNAKSVTQSLFEKMMGKLAIKLNTNIITGKKPSAGSTFAELARAGGGVRWAVMEEPDGDEAINVGVFKNLSGNDSFYARDLFEKGKDTKEICPLFKLIFICLSKGTSISLPSGISLSIENLLENKSLLGYDESRDGLADIKQLGLLKKGVQKCITLTLQDGRRITCTPNHKFLAASGEWIEAQNIVPGETALKMGVDNPNCDDMFESSDFKFVDFDLDTYKGKLQAMALCRLIGYVITDGTLNKTLYIGHQIDAENILRDIELLCDKRPKLIHNHKVLQISVPEELSRKICTLIEKQVGGKVNNISSYPDFVFDTACPLYLVREFLAAIFGGDGIVPPVFAKRIGSLKFVSSKVGQHINSLIKDFNRIVKLLKDRFNIEAMVTEPKLYDDNKFQLFIHINKHQDILRFAENIGFRYCCHKTYRLTAVASLLRYKDAIVAQNRDIIEKSNFSL
jgi:hypothetical protein